MNTIKQYKFYLAFFLITILAFWQIVFFVHPVKYDMIDCYLPWRYFIGECLQNGKFPFWNPYQNLGYPIHSDPSSGAWYPIVWLIGYFWGYSIYSIGFEFWIHVFIAAIGTYKLAITLKLSNPVSFITALCYILCGIFIGNSQHITYVISACWLPFVINYYLKICNEEKYINSFKAAIFLFLMITGGYPAFTIILFYLLVIFFIYYCIHFLKLKNKTDLVKFLARNVLFLILTILLSAGILLSIYEASPYITRIGQFTLTKALFCPFSPQSCISFILPFATVKNIEFFSTDFSMSNAYFGILMFLFFILGIFIKKPFQFKILFYFGLFALAASFGNYLPVREFLFNYVPMMNIFRFPSVFRLFTIIGFLFIAAYWLEKFLNNNFDKSRKSLKISLITLISLLILFIMTILFYENTAVFSFLQNDLFTFSKTSSLLQHILFQCAIQLVIVGVFMFIVWKVKERSKFIKYTIVVFAVELIFNAQLNEPYTTYYGEFSAKNSNNHIKKFPSGFPQLPDVKLSDINSSELYYGPFWKNVNIFQKKISPEGFNSFVFTGHEYFKEQSPLLFKKTIDNKIVFLCDNVFDEKDIKVFEKDSVYKSNRLFFKEKEFEQLKGQSFINKNSDSAKLVYFSPDSFIVKTNTENKQIITLLQNNYTGWEVLINQNTVKVYTSNNSLISAILPAGKNTVCFIYRNKGIKIALWISVGTLGLSLILILINKRIAKN